jgi:hypothetical protein
MIVHTNARVMSTYLRALLESHAYAASKPRRIPSADSPNRPTLEWLYKYAVWVHGKRPRAKQFTYEGVRYAIVWASGRMCVMHVRSACILVGAPGPRND